MAQTQLDNYVKASIPDPYTILGVTLRPFCIGHFHLMQRFECAFGKEGEDIQGGINDLLLAIAICSRTYEGFIEFVSDPKEFNSWCSKWGKEVKKAMNTDKNYNFVHKMLMFQQYMREGVIIPQFYQENNGSDGTKESGAHWTQIILLVLTSELNYTFSQAINMPLSKALFDYFKHLESSGMVTIMPDEDIALINKEEDNGNE